MPSEAPRFSGFGPGLVELYRGLHEQNSREYWLANKQVYEDDVRTPLELLAGELTPEFGEPKVFRPNRDLRFSKDKRPYKEQASLVVGDGSSALYAQVSADGLRVAGGWWQPSREQLAAFRQAVDDGERGDGLDQLLAELDAVGLELGTGSSLKTAPRGWAKDHPRIELLRLTTLTVGAVHPPRAWLQTRECLTRIVDHWHGVQRWNAYLSALPVEPAA
ncbi:DUF2461 domain-containing protein [Rhodococcus antarcticus]|uniref:DUF2461 domain-containing protein n=1 Tax=Rhodococcus antarcticus TaxID=2987751 RepID=A0ABY6P069_9NOCA|nr:DUF2461 domain-containing protein [Rhodococcus antarcticus]UZJ24933.1 DUF2461 domain-containing protein [Rhodococcus antarcticus]